MEFVIVFDKKSEQHNKQHLEEDYGGTKLPWILLKSEYLIENYQFRSKMAQFRSIFDQIVDQNDPN